MQGDDQTSQLILDGEYCEAVIPLIRAAKKEISLCMYSWRWYESEPGLGIQQVNIELLRALRRGVHVRCLVDTVQTFTRMSKQGFYVRYVPSNKLMHTKAIMIDQKYLVMGSHNLTKRANHDNYEVSVILNDFEVCTQFSIYFDTIFEVSRDR